MGIALNYKYEHVDGGRAIMQGFMRHGHGTGNLWPDKFYVIIRTMTWQINLRVVE